MMLKSNSQKLMFLLLFLFGAISNLSSNGSSSMNGCNKRDRDVLLLFKEGVVDPSNMLSSWSSEEDCCKWIGVQCHNSTGRVNKLNLRYSYLDPSYTSKRLGGEINLCLLQLEFLNHLDLGDNDFTAINDKKSYHNHLSKNFSALHGIDLSYNYNLQMDNLQWLSDIASLRYLDLSGIILEKETYWFQDLVPMSSLSELHLSMCGLNSLSSSLKYVNFTSLALLDLSSNYFHSEIPNWLSNLSDSLSYLDLRMNKFNGPIPNILSNLQNLKSLLLGVNNLSGIIPEWFGQYKNLQELDLSANSFHGSIPPTLGNLSSLIHLDVRVNNLNGSLPKSLGQLSNLETLLLGVNAFTGVVSESNFAKLSNLRWLDLRSSPLQFHIGNDWIPPFQLEEIFLGYCILGPTFPSWLYTQRSLRLFYIPNTGISTINHDKFWSLISNVSKRVDISNNSISGKIPDILLNAVSIDLSSNSFNGDLPRLTSNVVYFYAGYNSFSGPISPFFCGTHNAKRNSLFDLDLSYNLFSGELPECWMNWQNLHYVNLGGNNFTGKIPPSMGLLSDVVYLHLGSNNLFGDIPLSLKNCKSLVFLNLEGNKLSGIIPTWIGGKSTQVIQMRSNELVGSIPPQICQLQSLIILDLADNKLLGKIPDCLYNITSMSNPNLSPSSFTMGEHDMGYRFRLVTKGREAEYERNFKYMRLVDLSSNKLSGIIPPKLFNLSLLQSLNLSHNHLTRKIPQEIGQMKSLESLDLSRNQLFGEIPDQLSDLSFLSYLNLSFNLFIGKIPTGTQLQSFDASSYMGNLELCGAPLKNCTKEIEFADRKLDAEDDDEFLPSLYMGMGIGFAIGFWGVCAVLFFSKAINHAYFRFLLNTKDWIHTKMLLMMRSFH